MGIFSKQESKLDVDQADEQRARKAVKKLLDERDARGAKVQALAAQLVTEYVELLKLGEIARNAIGLDASQDLWDQSMQPARLAPHLLDFMAKCGAPASLVRRPIVPAHEAPDFSAVIADQSAGLLARFQG